MFGSFEYVIVFFFQRLKRACTSEEDWGPAEVANQWRHVDYYPAVNTRSMSISVGSCPNSPTLPIKSVSGMTVNTRSMSMTI